MSGTPPKSTGAALVLGGGVAGIQCALDLAEGGYKVYLVEKAPALGGHMAQLDKTFPTNDCSMCTLAPKLVEAGRHLNIEIVTNSELTGLEGEPGRLRGQGPPPRALRGPRHLHELRRVRAGVPRHGRRPVQRGPGRAQGHLQALPAGHPQHVRDHEEGPQPLQARLCRAHERAGLRGPHRRRPLRRGVHRGQRPQPLPRRLRPRLHAQVRDRLHARRGRRTHLHRRPQALRQRLGRRRTCRCPRRPRSRSRRRSPIVGAGPTGLSAARDLALLGYQTTVFESKAEAGGMLRFGIPEYRLPKAALQQDIDRILALGVDLQLRQDRRQGLHRRRPPEGDGYKAVYLATGLQGGRRCPSPAPTPRASSPPSTCSRATLGEPIDMGKNVVVIGGGDVAFDAGRTALRLGAEKVTITCIEDDESVPASADEIEEGLDESIAFICSCMPSQHRRPAPTAAPSKVEFIACSLGDPDERGWRPPVPIADTRARARLRHGHLRHRPGHGRRTSSRAPPASRSRRARSSPTRPRWAPARRACSPAATPPPAPPGRPSRPSPPAAAPRAASTTTCAARTSSPFEDDVDGRGQARRRRARQDRVKARTADAAPRRARRARHLGRGQHGLLRGAGRRRGQALPRLRHLLRVHGVRARLRPRRPAARRARQGDGPRRGRRRAGHGLRPVRPRRQERVRLQAATPTCSRRSSTSAC